MKQYISLVLALLACCPKLYLTVSTSDQGVVDVAGAIPSRYMDIVSRLHLRGYVGISIPTSLAIDTADAVAARSLISDGVLLKALFVSWE